MRRWIVVLMNAGLWCALAGGAAGDPLESLRLAVTDLHSTFGERYSGGPTFLARIAELEKRAASGQNVEAEIEKLRRAALAANPLLAPPIVFVTRHQYTKDHHNTATFFPAAQHEFNTGRYTPGGSLKVLDVASGRTRTLIELADGVVRDPEVSFDGRRILFSMRKTRADSYHLYQINVDGSGLAQLTKMADVDDLDPIYMPDGSIVFSSTREPKYCACNRHIMANLFRMNGDGSNIVQIGKSTLFEGHASLMPDGRILYDRWEYVDRNFGDAQGLWTSNPDGSNHAIFWGNNTPSPGGVLDGRIIPGTELVVCTFSSCHDRPWGAIAIVDRRLGSDGRSPVAQIWPREAIELVKDPGTANNAWDTFMRLKVKYEDPYPLADPVTHAGAGRYFLCAKMTGKGEQTGVALIDVFGNEIMLHVDTMGCFDPMPVVARRPPGAIPDRKDLASPEGAFYIQDVYLGTHMAGVKRGSVKSLRVVEVPEKKYWTNPGWNGQGFEGPAMNWHDFNFKQVLGTVPVEDDGSAYFNVPAEKFVYFQLLDEQGMMIQSMRSGTSVQGGEIASCVGCHEDRRTVPPSGYATPRALRRAPSKLEGWNGPARGFNYRTEVQPVFDRHCVSCHDFKDAATAKIVLAGDRGLAFNASYAELWSKGQIKVAGAGPAEIMQAYSWGSHASKLVKALQAGHYDVKLDAQAFERLVTWLDLNAPYYPSFATAFPDHPLGRSPLSAAQLTKLSQLTGQKLDRAPHLVSFDRPEASPCLTALKVRDETGYREALAIIASGREALAKTPNPDAAEFNPSDIDRWREAKYAQRQAIEAKHRSALKAQSKAYDAP